ncbi:MAG: thiamine diphosphokinase [Dehalococcoidia bacterium]|nr:thiamine diphosphokinase [Dehalococcoidia bacterium]
MAGRSITAMRAVVFANGELPTSELVAEVCAGAGLLVAADGGVDKALAAGVTVDAVVGDLDSVSDDARGRVHPSRLHRIHDLDTTDLQKAILFCLARGAARVDVLAAGGGRADHALANLSVIPLFRGKADVRIHDDLFEVSLVDGEAVVDARPGTVVSLVAVSPCEGVTTHGLRWDLHDYPLRFSPYGVHNEVAHPPARIQVARGELLLFRGRWVESHSS